MDVDVPCPEDHLGFLVHVKLCHSTAVPQPTAISQVSFNRIFERLRRLGSIVVSDNPPRLVVPNFVASVAECKPAWGEFQQHRKIVGLICVGFLEDGQVNGCNETVANHEAEKAEIKGKNVIPETGFSTVLHHYQTLKEQYRATLVDARCVIIGACSSHDLPWTPLDGVLRFSSLDDAAQLEHDIQDYVKAVYWVLEGKRLDLSFEKLDFPPFPVAPDEEKYLVGIDRTGRAFRKRCIGRLRKQVADVTLITGLPTLAVESYNVAIDQLKSANDWLWLAGAYEGYACAALIAKYGKANLESLASPSSSLTTLQRTPTFTPGEMKKAQHSRQHSPRSTSSSSRRAFASVRSESKNNAVKLLISDADIEEKFQLAIANYQKFTFAACIESECAFKASSVYLVDRRFGELDEFMNINCARFLDEKFKGFTDTQKGHICNLISAVYKRIGFRRKMAFFTRLSALFRLYLSRDDPVTSADYRQVYPLLVSSLDGYRIPWAGWGSPAVTHGGWPALQVRALHETYVSALRAQHKEAAIRHLAHIIQVALESPGTNTDETLYQFCAELAQLTSQQRTHNISTHLRLSDGAILPPVHLTKLPKFLCIDVRPLPPHLSPCVVPDSLAKAVFIYSPFQTNSHDTQVRWVCGCTGVVLLKLQNLLPRKLELKNLSIVGEGVAFDSSFGMLALPPKSNTVSVEVHVTPKEPGILTVTGCSCEVLGIKTTCRFDDVPWLKRNVRLARVEVLPPLPVLEVATSMRPTENQKPSEITETCTAEIALYAGQKQIERVDLVNVSDVDVERLEWDVQQPTVSGLTPLVSIQDSDGPLTLPISQRTTQSIDVCITAVDPLAIEGEREHDQKERDTGDGVFDTIPYTGRVLTATVKFLYCAGIKKSDAPDDTVTMYQRCCALTIYVTILPVVVVVDWHVLPGEKSNNRYIALDVLNAADYEVDVHFPVERSVTVQPKDICRVPVLCECCDLTMIGSTTLRGARAKHYIMEARRKLIQEHVLSRLKVRWALVSNPDACGDVPIGAVLTSARLCKELVMPRLMLEVFVAGAEGDTNDEYIIGVGERVTMSTNIVQWKRQGSAVASLRLSFFQDYHNGLTSAAFDEVLQFGVTSHIVNLGQDGEKCTRDFHFLFCNEGIYKVTLLCDISSQPSVLEDSENQLEIESLLFGSPVMPVLSFNVVSRPDAIVPL